eukprot:19052-Eustigmatos_ZCMA.PRE.1
MDEPNGESRQARRAPLKTRSMWPWPAYNRRAGTAVGCVASQILQASITYDMALTRIGKPLP